MDGLFYEDLLLKNQDKKGDYMTTLDELVREDEPLAYLEKSMRELLAKERLTDKECTELAQRIKAFANRFRWVVKQRRLQREQYKKMVS